MKSIFLNSITSGLETDFKAEVIAAEMVENNIPDDRIMILMLGGLQRSFRRDVDSIAEEISNYDHKEYFHLKTHKEGIYDMLPEGLFHHAASNKSAKSEKEIIESIKQRRVEERNARRFFLPFEAAINHLRMQMALYENKLDKTSHYDESLKIFSSYWGIFEHLDTRQSNIFFHMLPVMHNIRDKYGVIETIMEIMFQLPVEIILQSQLPVRPLNPVISQLADSTLGVDFTTGNAIYNSGEDEIMIHFGPLNIEEFQQFMPGTKNSKILEFLCDYFMPVHVDIVTQFELYDKDKIMRLDDGVNNFNSVLGSDTYL
ncbi:MAG: type VI secretion system baseplate subunit TssG [Ginsengibacter sp.]